MQRSRPVLPSAIAATSLLLVAASWSRCEGLSDLGQTWPYAQTAWATIHRSARSADFAPFVAPAENRVKWTALEGATTVTSVTIGPEGHLYASSGQGPGASHLHAFDRDGKLLWKSAPQESLDDLDSLAVSSAPVVDRRGHVYLGDANQLWSFDARGRVRWVSPLPEDSGALVTAILTREGLVGGVTTQGKVALYRRSDGALARPVLDLPGGAGPPCQGAPAGLWAEGLLDPTIVPSVFCGLAGLEVEVGNTPAVHPKTGRIFVPGSGASPEEGALYGIDVLPDRLEVAFASPLGAGSGTSPALSPDGSAVYAAGRDGVLIAIDTATGTPLWRAEDTGGVASPAVGPDGTVYTGGGASSLVALRPEDGSVKWRQRYDELAAGFLPEIMPVPPVLPSASPVARTNSVVSVSARKLWVVLNLGYELVNPFTGLPVATPNVVVLAALDPTDGSIVAEPQLLPDTSEAIIAIDDDGSLYVSLAAGLSSAIFYGFNPLLPPEVRVPGPPVAGITALEPVSFLAHVLEGIGWVRELDAEALEALGRADADASLAALTRGTVQLEASQQSIRDAETRGEIDTRSAAAGRALIRSARSRLSAARLLLDRASFGAARHLAAAAITRAERALAAAQQVLSAPHDARVIQEKIEVPGFSEPHTPGSGDARELPLSPRLVELLGPDPDLNRVTYVRTTFADPVHPGRRWPTVVLILVPGFSVGARTVDPLARDLVSAFGGSLEVWAVDRRPNRLEDRLGARHALSGAQRGDPEAIREGANFYFPDQDLAPFLDFPGAEDLDFDRDGVLDGPLRLPDGSGDARSALLLEQDDARFLAHWGVDTYARDWKILMERARARVGRRGLVLFGGHSQGTTWATLYCAYDFDPGPGVDAGYERIDGLLLLEGSGIHPDGGFAFPELPARPGDAAEYRARVAELARPGSPEDVFLDEIRLSDISLVEVPPFGAGVELAAIAASFQPEGPSLLQRLPPITSSVLSLFLSAPTTNRAAFGLLLDDDFQPFTPFRASVGFSDDGPNQLLALPVPGFEDLLDQFYVASPASEGSLRTWKEFRDPTLPACPPNQPGVSPGCANPDNGPPPDPAFEAPRKNGIEREVTDMNVLIQTQFGYENGVEWYFAAGRANLDVSFGNDSSALGDESLLAVTRNAHVDVPVLAIGGSNGMTPEPRSFDPYLDSIATPAGDRQVVILEGYAHADVVMAEDNEAVPVIEDWIRRLSSGTSSATE